MARIAGVTIPDDKQIVIALTRVRGVGRSAAARVLSEAGVDVSTRAKDVSPEDIARIQKIVEGTCEVEGALARKERMSLKRLKDIRCYRGLRHERNLPVRGQRTKTNARTRKGKKRAIGGTGIVRGGH